MAGLKIKKHIILLLIGTLVSFHCYSQDNTEELQYPKHDILPAPPADEEILYKGSLQVGGGIAYALSNKALRVSLGGVYLGHASLNYIFKQHIYGGLELENSQFGNTGYGVNYQTLMLMFSAGPKIGYYTYMQNDFLFCYSLSGGPSLIKYNRTPAPAPKGGFKQTSFFLTANWLASYRVNNELRIGFDLSFDYMGYHYDPKLIGLDQAISGYDPSWALAPTMYFEWGFGIYWAFAEQKGTK